MKHMVLGFAFNVAKNKVLLIRKNRPDWQAGKFNGIGGHIEREDEHNGRTAMSREFLEETGIRARPFVWDPRGLIEKQVHRPGDESWMVSVYSVTLGDWEEAKQVTDEKPEWVNIKDLDALALAGECLENVPVLVALCLLQKAQPSNSFPRFVLEY